MDEQEFLTRFLKVAAERSFAQDGIAFYMIDRPPHETKKMVVGFKTEPLEERMEAMWTAPAFVLTVEAAQRLMDDLYHCGVRPSDAGESVGALSATKLHLEDMRKLAETLLEKVLGKDE